MIEGFEDHYRSRSYPIIQLGPRSAKRMLRRSYSSGCLLSHSPNPFIDRIDKILTSRGVESRSQASLLLQQGRVKVEGKIIRGRGERVSSQAEITINGIDFPPLPLLYAYHKPVGVLSSVGDPWGRPNLSELQQKFPILKDMHPVVEYFIYSSHKQHRVDLILTHLVFFFFPEMVG
jgi:hypothetical protein